MFTSIINLACTCHPIKLDELLIKRILKQDSASANPVTYQGFNSDLLDGRVLCFFTKGLRPIELKLL